MMETAVIGSQIILWIAVVALALVVAALTRQVGVLHERIAPAGALTLHQKLKSGDAAPKLEVMTLAGEAVQVNRDSGPRSRLFFFVSPDCPVCKHLLPIVRHAAKSEAAWLDVIYASDGPEPQHRSFVAEQSLSPSAYVLSEPLGRALGVSRLPYGVLVDENGKIASMGLINNREHLESLFVAKERNVASIQDYLARG
ncbi:redoxin family protein [Sphingobium sp. CECT 9361]|uniref:redoxin family protein n=1 Tax=Sphingobium sp. CECT 9361 TaxID=2845384 RepID=UPI001E48069C|nr:redoxin family protein [Sphingobium sp. CECT 9361]CAH0357234.1 Methylamine utilization protein MauD [Sphingobium sp. CECT 9361]